MDQSFDYTAACDDETHRWTAPDAQAYLDLEVRDATDASVEPCASRSAAAYKYGVGVRIKLGVSIDGQPLAVSTVRYRRLLPGETARFHVDLFRFRGARVVPILQVEDEGAACFAVK